MGGPQAHCALRAPDEGSSRLRDGDGDLVPAYYSGDLVGAEGGQLLRLNHIAVDAFVRPELARSTITPYDHCQTTIALLQPHLYFSRVACMCPSGFGAVGSGSLCQTDPDIPRLKVQWRKSISTDRKDCGQRCTVALDSNDGGMRSAAAGRHD